MQLGQSGVRRVLVLDPQNETQDKALWAKATVGGEPCKLH